MTHLRARHAAAALDVWIDQFLRAYSGIAGYCLRPETGELAVHYIRLLAVFNREYEHRLAVGGSLALEQVMRDPLVAARLLEWERFASEYTDDREVIEFLSRDSVAADYRKYVTITSRSDFPLDPALIIESMGVDSGAYLTYLIWLVERFNDRRPLPAISEGFFNLGMTAKLADEMADLATDFAEGRYNLLLALIGQHPAERAVVLMRLEQALPMPVNWWLEHAPKSFKMFAELFEGYYLALPSQQMRQLCDVTMIRALRGPSKHQAQAAGQHVSDRPSEPWR